MDKFGHPFASFLNWFVGLTAGPNAQTGDSKTATIVRSGECTHKPEILIY
jgi:hypothetical protein